MANDTGAVPAAEHWVPTVALLNGYGPYHRPAAMPLHWRLVTAQWLTETLANRYPGVVVESIETVELKNTHTTKLRLAVTYNQAGRSAGLPAHLCLKANFTGRANPLDVCQMEARFYQELAEGTDMPAPIRDSIWEQYRRWPMYGLQSWMGTKDHWGQDNHSMIERFSVASADLDTLALLESQL